MNHLPRLETRQTQHLRQNYPPIEYLESDFVPDWLLTRKEQLLELAKEERSGVNTAKTISIVCGFAGFIFHATSPLAPVGAICGIGAYVWSVFKDIEQTSNFSPLPFLRGNLLDTIGNLGHAGLREEFLSNKDDFAGLSTYLPPKEREEYLMLDAHLHTVTEYLSQVPKLKRFHAYSWILSSFIKLKGAFPSQEQLHTHVSKVAFDSVHIDQVVFSQLEQSSLPAPVVFSQPLSLPSPVVRELPAPTVLQPQLQATTTTPKQTKNFGIDQLKSLPLRERAIAVIEKLKQSGFNVQGCIQGQTTVVAGQQRGGKGTLLAILAILSKAIDPSLKIYYFTAGSDTYPFKCEELVSAKSFPHYKDPDAKVAQSLVKFLDEMSKSEVGSYSDRILVIDEAIALSEHLSPEQNQFLAKFLLTRAEKTGCQTFVVLHASNLTAWIGAKNTAGISATFKSSATFVGCVAKSIQINPLKTISVATGEYFLADPNSFGKSVPDGELGIIPEWLKTETNPLTGMPDPARTLLTIFPELKVDEENNFVDAWADCEEDEEVVREVSYVGTTNQSSSVSVQRVEPLQDKIFDQIDTLGSGSSEPVRELEKERELDTFTPLNLSEPQIRGMIELFGQSKNQTEVIETLWQVRKGGGKAYEKAREEYLRISGAKAE